MCQGFSPKIYRKPRFSGSRRGGTTCTTGPRRLLHLDRPHLLQWRLLPAPVAAVFLPGQRRAAALSQKIIPTAVQHEHIFFCVQLGRVVFCRCMSGQFTGTALSDTGSTKYPRVVQSVPAVRNRHYLENRHYSTGTNPPPHCCTRFFLVCGLCVCFAFFHPGNDVSCTTPTGVDRINRKGHARSNHRCTSREGETMRALEAAAALPFMVLRLVSSTLGARSRNALAKVRPGDGLKRQEPTQDFSLHSTCWIKNENGNLG